MAIAALVLGIVGLIMGILGFLGVPGIIGMGMCTAAIILGALGMRTKKGPAIAGLVLGIVGLVIAIITFACCGCTALTVCTEATTAASYYSVY